MDTKCRAERTRLFFEDFVHLHKASVSPAFSFSIMYNVYSWSGSPSGGGPGSVLTIRLAWAYVSFCAVVGSFSRLKTICHNSSSVCMSLIGSPEEPETLFAF